MNCKHENNKLIDYGTSIGMFGCEYHSSTFKCSDCGKTYTTIDDPIIYSYPQKTELFKGYLLPVEDVEILKRKFEEVERNRRGD